MNLYIFDRELRLLVLDAIERFEVSLRTQLAYHLSHNNNTSHPHLSAALFYDRTVYTACLDKLSLDVKHSNEDFIKHLRGKYSEPLPPIWAAVELMTMGQLSKWFGNVKERRDRQTISKVYGVDEKVMTSFCEQLSLVRNHSAHHARLWNRDFTKTMIRPKKGPPDLITGLVVLPVNDRRLRKHYNVLVMLAHLMDTISGEHRWKFRLIKLIHQHGINPSPMGFPVDWEKRAIWRSGNVSHAGSASTG